MKRLILVIFVAAVIALVISCGSPVVTNQPPEFISSYPENGVSDVPTDTTLHWEFKDRENDPLSYTVKIGMSEDDLIEKYNGTKNEYKPQLEPSKTYYWQIIADDTKNKSTSKIMQFSTVKVNASPEKPKLIYPVGVQNVNYSSVTFEWSCVDPDKDPLKFELYINGTFVATATNGRYTKTNFQPDTEYSWYVKAFDGEYTSQSDVVSFKTAMIGENRAPNTPQLISPPDGAQSLEIPVNLQWSCSDPDEDNLTYEVYLEDHLESTTSDSSYILSNLSPNTTYRWYLKVSDGTNQITGPVWEFTTKGIPNNPPEQPANPSPEDNSNVYQTEVTLSWSCFDQDNDKLFYNVYFGESSNPPLIRQNIENSAVVIQDLETGKRYFWKVVATDGSTSTEGPLWTFDVASEDEGAILLALTDSGVHKLDFSSLANPSTSEIATFTGNDICYYDDTLYVIGNTLNILQDSSLATSTFGGNYISVSTLIPLQRIIAGELYAIVTDESSISLLDVSDPENVSHISSLPIQGEGRIFVQGEKIFVCSSNSLKIIDATIPQEINEEETIPCEAKDVVVVDNYCYVLTSDRVLKINIGTLEEAGQFEIDGEGKRIRYGSGYIYVLTNSKLMKLNENLSKEDEVDVIGETFITTSEQIYLSYQNTVTIFDNNFNEIKRQSFNTGNIKELILPY
ncbi:hypothetical protein [Pseudothermotoga sp.]|uniref:hypothetical protein n=1 Tax=Pseudothermotoga sp. TaxID=2033661 RepID=UPI000E8E3896|nr:hypothetical protein [Pseudothermotoga sp.]HBJ81196.1 hypothetical protein [Pseudothermotoga sp.]